MVLIELLSGWGLEDETPVLRPPIRGLEDETPATQGPVERPARPCFARVRDDHLGFTLPF
jgi:hypothetical protein